MTLPTIGLILIGLILLVIGIRVLSSRDWLWNLETRRQRPGAEPATRTEAWDASRKTRGQLILVAGIVMLAVGIWRVQSAPLLLVEYLCSKESDVAGTPAEQKSLVLYGSGSSQGTFGGEPLTWSQDLGFELHGLSEGTLYGSYFPTKTLYLSNSRYEYACEVEVFDEALRPFFQ